ncbi:MAG: leucine-rich repeat protein [Bacteroidetes bacterium]|nr:leucine-rich repeat protein [Bacteroidota bacterium]
MLKQAPLHRSGTVPLYGGAGVVDSRYDEQPPLQRSATVPLPWRGDICESKCRGGKLTQGFIPVIIAIVLAISMSANVMAQTPSCPASFTTNDEVKCANLGSITDVECDNITAIGDNAFKNCYSLKNVSFPNVTSIAAQAFESCTGLISASFPKVTSISAITTFTNCSQLTSIYFPTLTTISNRTFENTNLEDVSFPSLGTLNEEVFNNCINLKKVSLPSVTFIQGYAFMGCINLDTITLGSTPPELGSPGIPTAANVGYVFQNVTLKNITVCIPVGSMDDYETAWTQPIMELFKEVVECDAGTHSLTLEIDGDGIVTGVDEEVVHGTFKKITATANSCYEFVNWTNSDDDEVSKSSTLDVFVVRDTTLTANFTPITTPVTLSVSSNNTTMGTASSSESSATCGTPVTVTATPLVGYKFVGWNDGSKIVSNAPSYTFNISKDTTLTAIFDIAKKKFHIKKVNVKDGRLIIKPQP